MENSRSARMIDEMPGSREMNPGSQSVLYCYTLPEVPSRNGKAKIGMATLHSGFETPEDIIGDSVSVETRSGVELWTSDAIESAARERIDSQIGATHMEYSLEWAVLAVRESENPAVSSDFEYITDHVVHDVLKRSGFTKEKFGDRSSEWFTITAEEALDAVGAAKEQRDHMPSVVGNAGTVSAPQFSLRAEQQRFIDETWAKFADASVDFPIDYYWNAIMRFGKTFTAFSLIEQTSIDNVLIVSHRGVNSSWHEDFGKVLDTDEYSYYSKDLGGDLSKLSSEAEKVVAYASLQDLRGSFHQDIEDLLEMDVLPSNLLKKNAGIFEREWDLIIIDEAHEGTLTPLAKFVQKHLKSSRNLMLSGTPYNLSEEFGDNVSNWGFIEEQEAKHSWDEENDGPNPYENIVGIELRNMSIDQVIDHKTDSELDLDGKNFKFSELFRVKDSADEESTVAFRKSGKPEKYHGFVHEDAVLAFLDRLSKSDPRDKTKFPYGNSSMRKVFAHTLWFVPGVREARALQELMVEHAHFENYEIVNVTGGETDSAQAIRDVKNAVRETTADSGKHGTITLSCGRLTVGSTVPEWTAVFMMSDTESAIQYMQTIFRAKTPGILPNGQRKSTMYAFDFKPDRCLQIVSSMASSAAKNRASADDAENSADMNATQREEKHLGELLHWMPCVSMNGSSFEVQDAAEVMRTVKEVFIGRILSSRFESNDLFDKDKMNNITEDIANMANRLGSALPETSKSVTISESKVSDRQRELSGKEKPRKSDYTDSAEFDADKREHDEAKKAVKKEQENRQNLLKILRAVSAKIPLMVFAHPPNKRVYLDTFASSIDESSWREFMPSEISRHGDGLSWDTIKGFFNETNFDLAVDSFREQIAEILSRSGILEQALGIAGVFTRFANPDKETVLTPWRVVNLQLPSTLGGVRWCDEDGVDIEDPVYVNPFAGVEGREEIAAEIDAFWKSSESTVFEINSKTALYPLYAALTLFVQQMQEKESAGEQVDEKALWKHIVENQIFVNVRTEHAAAIARQVLTLGINGAGDGDDASVGSIGVNVCLVDIAKLSKHLRSTVKKDVDGVSVDVLMEKVWRFVFDKSDFAGAGERAERVLDTRNATEVKELVDHVDAGDSVDAVFDAVVGNPPYQGEDQSNGEAPAIYHLFMDSAKNLGNYVSLIYPSKWTNIEKGGMGEFAKNELSSLNYVNFFIESDEKFFGNAIIKGGVCYFLWNRTYSGVTGYSYNGNCSERTSLLNGSKVFIGQSDFNGIVEKVGTVNHLSPKGVSHYGNIFSEENVKNFALEVNEKIESVRIYYSGKGGGVRESIIPRNKTPRSPAGYKVFISKTADPMNGSLRRPGKIFTGVPGEICSSSFIPFTDLKTKDEAQNALRYLKTDFAMFLLGAITPTHNSGARVYKLIPDVNFATGEIKDKPGVFIDFTVDTVDEIDDQLAEIYGLTDEERELMRNSIKPWKDKNSLTADGLY